MISSGGVEKLRSRFGGPAMESVVEQQHWLLREQPVQPDVAEPMPAIFADFLKAQQDRVDTIRAEAAAIFGINDPAVLRLKNTARPKPSSQRPSGRVAQFPATPASAKASVGQPFSQPKPTFGRVGAPRPPRIGSNPFGVSPGVSCSVPQPARSRPSTPKAVGPSVREKDDAAWAAFFFDGQDRQRWQNAGVRPGEARLAAGCQQNNISPTDLSLKLSGSTVLERLRYGESPQQVWARMQEAAQTPKSDGKYHSRLNTA